MRRLGRLDEKWHLRVLLVAICAYSLIFSATTIWKHYCFNSYAWDLGTFDQIMHDSVFEGRPFYYTLDLFMNPSGQYFAIHFTPILVLLFPLYRVFPAPELLLIVKSIAVGAAAYPLYMLTRRITGNSRTGLLLGLTYLLSPGIHGANWFDFQPQSLLPLLIFSSFYLLESGSTRLYLVTVALTLLVEEHSSVIVPMMLLVYLLGDGVKALPRRLTDRRTQAIIILTTIMTVSAFAASLYYKQTYLPEPQFSDVYVSADAYNVLGFDGNAFNAPLYAATHPADLIRAASYDSLRKVTYLLFLFAPLFFTPLRSGATAISSLLLTPFLLSNYRAYYMIGAHYPFYVMPLLLISTVYFLRGRADAGRGVAALILVSTTVFALAISPLSPASALLADDTYILWYPRNNLTPQEVADMHALIDSIPGDASILTQNHLFPHTSGRINAYAIPVTAFSNEQLPAIENYIRGLMEDSQYVLLDPSDGNPLTPITITMVEGDPRYARTASAGDVTLWTRHP